MAMWERSLSAISDDNQGGNTDVGRASAAPLLFETEGGLVVVQNGRVLASQPATKKNPDRLKDVAKLGEKAKSIGVMVIGVADREAAGVLEGIGLETVMVTGEQRDALNADKLGIMVRAGFALDEAAAVEIVRGGALAAAEEKISEESSREDLHLVHAIQGLDELDRFLNITTERVAEWYGLHFPELQALIADNVALAKLIVESGGQRANFDEEKLQGKGFSDKKIEAIFTAAERSKGGTATERDMNRTVALAEVGLAVAAEREKLAEYVESTMKRIAPNTTDVAGATIGARLIAKVGGLDRLARLPASTIQVLGAEKALFRALRTGSRPPKHGILFQHEAVHTAPKWQRGKIARALANKIAIAARIDYYRGEKDGALTATLEKRLDEIRIKYKEPREPAPFKQRSFGDDRKRSRQGKKGPRREGRRGREGGPYKEPGSRDLDLRGRPRKDRRD
jgi:nucleolar protein 56